MNHPGVHSAQCFIVEYRGLSMDTHKRSKVRRLAPKNSQITELKRMAKQEVIEYVGRHEGSSQLAITAFWSAHALSEIGANPEQIKATAAECLNILFSHAESICQEFDLPPPLKSSSPLAINSSEEKVSEAFQVALTEAVIIEALEKAVTKASFSEVIGDAISEVFQTEISADLIKEALQKGKFTFIANSPE